MFTLTLVHAMAMAMVGRAGHGRVRGSRSMTNITVVHSSSNFHRSYCRTISIIVLNVSKTPRISQQILLQPGGSTFNILLFPCSTCNIAKQPTYSCKNRRRRSSSSSKTAIPLGCVCLHSTMVVNYHTIVGECSTFRVFFRYFVITLIQIGQVCIIPRHVCVIITLFYLPIRTNVELVATSVYGD